MCLCPAWVCSSHLKVHCSSPQDSSRGDEVFSNQCKFYGFKPGSNSPRTYCRVARTDIRESVGKPTCTILRLDPFELAVGKEGDNMVIDLVKNLANGMRNILVVKQPEHPVCPALVSISHPETLLLNPGLINVPVFFFIVAQSGNTWKFTGRMDLFSKNKQSPPGRKGLYVVFNLHHPWKWSTFNSDCLNSELTVCPALMCTSQPEKLPSNPQESRRPHEIFTRCS